jgi:hypothetical protein
MRRQIAAASISVVLLSATAGIACAQGYVTQDPGSLAPGNLTFQNLGPSSPLPVPPPPRLTIPLRGSYGPSGPGAAGAKPGTSATGSSSGSASGSGGNLSGSGR